MLKADKKTVCICGDFKQAVNPVSKWDTYPIPRVEDLFAKLAGGKTFTKLDLSQAYQQLPLDDESKQYVVINTQQESAFKASKELLLSSYISTLS